MNNSLQTKIKKFFLIFLSILTLFLEIIFISSFIPIFHYLTSVILFFIFFVINVNLLRIFVLKCSVNWAFGNGSFLGKCILSNLLDQEYINFRKIKSSEIISLLTI